MKETACASSSSSMTWMGRTASMTRFCHRFRSCTLRAHVCHKPPRRAPRQRTTRAHPQQMPRHITPRNTLQPRTHL